MDKEAEERILAAVWARLEPTIGSIERITAEMTRNTEALTLLRLPPNLKCLTVGEVAEQLQISCPSVRRLIEAGELRAKLIQGQRRKLYRITVSNLEAYISNTPGAKKKPPDDSDGLVEVPNVDI